MTAATVTVGRSGVEVGRFEPGSEEWHAARAGFRLGGSEVAAVIGLSPWESMFSLWHRKAAHIGPQAENPEMEWGKRLEDAVAGKFADDHPEYVVERAATYRHADREWQIANPDRLLRPHLHAADVELWEGKTALYPDDWGPTGSDEIPVYYRAQVLHYLDTLGVDSAHVSVLIGGHDYREYVIKYDEAEALWMRHAAEGFIASLEAGNPPSIDGHTATYTAVRELHPDIDPVDVPIDPQLAGRYRDALLGFDTADEEKRCATSLVLDAIGGGRRAVVDRRPIACRVPGRNGNRPHLTPSRGLKQKEIQP